MYLRSFTLDLCVNIYYFKYDINKYLNTAENIKEVGDMKKEITIKEFADELSLRIDKDQGIDCCKSEIKKLAAMAKKHMGDEKITVDWKD